MEAFLIAFRNYVAISEADESYFYYFFTQRKYKNGARLLNEGEVEHEVFFVMKGALRQYFLNEKGDERTCNLTFENTFLTDLESFSRQSKASTNIIALEPTE